jgi:dTMP kinase
MIIAVEGADKAGKHTQVMKIVEYLNGRGIATETLDFPQYNSYWGGFIKDYLNGKFGTTRNLPAEYTMLPYALDRQAHMPQIKKWLDAGKWVVFDRYTYSNAFSIAKLPRDQWQDKIAYLEDMEFNQMGIIRPDYNIYLYLPAQISYAMRTQGLKAYQNGKPDIHESDLKLLEDVSSVYKTIAQQNAKNWTVVNEIKSNGMRMNPNEVFDCMRGILDKYIARTK